MGDRCLAIGLHRVCCCVISLDSLLTDEAQVPQRLLFAQPHGYLWLRPPRVGYLPRLVYLRYYLVYNGTALEVFNDPSWGSSNITCKHDSKRAEKYSVAYHIEPQ